MLSEQEKKEIDAEIVNFPYKRAAVIEALKVIQNHRRWVSDDSIADLSEYLEMTPEEIDSVATFYNLVYRRPVGRNIIHICDSVSCWILGYENLLTHLENKLGIKLGETTEDERFTLLPIPCLGTCDRAPALMINDDLHRDLSEDKLDKILENYK